MAFEPDTSSTATAAPKAAPASGRPWRLLVGLAGFLVSLALTFLGLLAITFFIGRALPVDPVLAMVGDRAPKAVYEAAKLQLGLDKPLVVQFIHYVGAALSGDFGMSVSTGRPVAEDLKRVFPATLEMATLGAVIGIVLGVPMGVRAASRQGGLPGRLVRVIGLFGYPVPAFWLALAGLAVFYARLQWVGGPGRIDIYYDGLVDPITGLMLVDTLLAGETEIFWNAVLHLVLPACVLGFFSLAYIARMTRSIMLDQLTREYAATASGAAERLVTWRHAVRPILVPLITVCGLSYAGLLEGAVMIETIFSWPGIGNYLTVALLNADMPAVLGATLVIGAMFIGVSKISDALYGILDSRAQGPTPRQAEILTR